MKQRITVEQLQELTDEQQQKLRDWWKPETGDVCINGNTIILFEHGCSYFGVNISWNTDYNYNYPSLETVKEHCIPLLSIGQMIELLEHCHISQYDFENILNAWVVGQNLLCDSLWDEVKQIL